MDHILWKTNGKTSSFIATARLGRTSKPFDQVTTTTSTSMAMMAQYATAYLNTEC
jgi:hypothetical protein